MIVKCSYCGKEIKRFPCEIIKNSFCSKECEKNFRKGKSIGQKKFNEIIIKDNYAIIKINNNLLGELDCLIDIEDIEKIKKYYWNIRYDKRHPKCTVYVEAHYLHKRIHLHRLLTNCPEKLVVDHINGNGLDNRKSNLRIVTQRQNTCNRTHKEIRGVYFNKRDNYYITQVSNKVFGRFRTKEEAIELRKKLNELIKKGEWKQLEEMECINLTNRKYKQLPLTEKFLK